MTVHVLYSQRSGGTWVASTRGNPKLRISAPSYDEAQARIEEIIRFALNSADVEIEHAAGDVPAAQPRSQRR